MLQCDQDRDDGLFMLRPVDIHGVLVMQGHELLADNRDDLPLLIIQFKIQGGDVALQLPAEAFDIRDIADQVELLF